LVAGADLRHDGVTRYSCDLFFLSIRGTFLCISLQINQQVECYLLFPCLESYSSPLALLDSTHFLVPVVRLQAPDVGTIGQAHQDMPILHIVCGVLSAHFSTATNKNYLSTSVTVTDLLS